VSGRIFNLAGPRWMSVEEMVSTFARALDVKPPTARIPRWLGLGAGWAAELAGALLRVNPPISRRTLAFFENDNAFDISAARRALKYEPRTELLDGVRRTLLEERSGAEHSPAPSAQQAR
jgi:nucleoside-diphosphate-sugar epimerase